jgi:hypothetical protein
VDRRVHAGAMTSCGIVLARLTGLPAAEYDVLRHRPAEESAGIRWSDLSRVLEFPRSFLKSKRACRPWVAAKTRVRRSSLFEQLTHCPADLRIGRTCREEPEAWIVVGGHQRSFMSVCRPPRFHSGGIESSNLMYAELVPWPLKSLHATA